MKKVFICGFHQESNTFNPLLAGKDSFDIYEAREVNAQNEKLPLIFKGIFEAISGASLETVSGPVFYASSGGPVDHRVIDDFMDEALSSLQKAGKVDGVVMALHGATTSDISEDVCGDMVETVRRTVGEKTLISSAFDLHANITSKIRKNSDFISGYQTYPHLDMRETGFRAAGCLIKGLMGVKTATVCVGIPQMAPAHAYTTGTGRLALLMKKAEKLKKEETIEDYSIFQVQPWLDVRETASTVVVRAQNAGVAQKAATQLAQEQFDIRKDLLGDTLLSVEDVIRRAADQKTGKPIILADAADSPNAGACGDSAYILEKLLPYKDSLAAAIGLIDVPAIQKAYKVGVGNTAEFTLGATIAPKLSKPVTVKAMVKSLHDGHFQNTGPQEKGKDFYLGRTAVLSIGKILLHVPQRGRMGDPAFYRSFGIEPQRCQLVCVKACTSFRAAYADIAGEIYNADTPGAAVCVLTNLCYTKIPRPFYPFDEITFDSISQAKYCRESIG